MKPIERPVDAYSDHCAAVAASAVEAVDVGYLREDGTRADTLARSWA